MCYSQYNFELCAGQLLIEANRTIDAVVETIAKIMEFDEAEAVKKYAMTSFPRLGKRQKSAIMESNYYEEALKQF